MPPPNPSITSTRTFEMDTAPQCLSVWLQETLVGTITRLPQGDLNIFTFDPAFLADANRPTLSLGFKGPMGNIAHVPRPFNTRVHPFFANLLPEGHLRDYLAQRDGIHRDRDFLLLLALGDDLPGAVRIRADGAPMPLPMEHLSVAPPLRDEPLKFSLAGVQLKFSAVRSASGGLTIPAYGRGGAWILKLPSERFAAVPENEYAMMSLAARAGFAVPAIDLVPLRDIQGLPPGLRQDATAFAIERFDRVMSPAPARVHIEDFAQVFHLMPADKYGKLSYGNLARVIWAETGESGLRDFIARLVFNAAIGNGDMHAKNWSLIYPDGRTPQLAPAYDFISTLTYVAGRETMALSLAGSRDFQDLSLRQFERLAEKAGVPVDMVVDAARDSAVRTQDAWADARAGMNLPAGMKDAITRHMAEVPILHEGAHPRSRRKGPR